VRGDVNLKIKEESKKIVDNATAFAISYRYR